MTEHLTKTQSAYVADYMHKVSRSFSLVAGEVERPMNDYLGAAYLICRVVDNIEDTEQPFDWQRRRFAEFQQMLDDPGRAAAVLAGWEGESWPGLTADEARMMTRAGGLTLWEIYAALPAPYRASIHGWAGEMAQGMCRSVDPADAAFFHQRNGVRLPHTRAGYDRYCYYVAGTVGSMITEMIVRFYDIDEETAGVLTRGSQSCGRGLQKTNIVKDFARDLGRGFCFLPDEWLAPVGYAPLALEGAPAAWKQQVIGDALAELDDSVPYLTNLPRHALGYRQAGLLMLLPAYETLLLAARRLPDLFTPRHEVKIARAKMMQAVAKAKRLAGDDAALRAAAGELSGEVRAELARHG